MNALATPLVGRDAPLRQLDELLARAGQADGAGSIVLLSGEAGIGKTRLCAELAGRHQRRGGQVLVGRATSDDVLGTYNAILVGPALLPLRVDALLRLGQADHAAQAVAAAEAVNLGHNRFTAAGLATARFRLAPSAETAAAAEKTTMAARGRGCAPWRDAGAGSSCATSPRRPTPGTCSKRSAPCWPCSAPTRCSAGSASGRPAPIATLGRCPRANSKSRG